MSRPQGLRFRWQETCCRIRPRGLSQSLALHRPSLSVCDTSAPSCWRYGRSKRSSWPFFFGHATVLHLFICSVLWKSLRIEFRVEPHCGSYTMTCSHRNNPLHYTTHYNIFQTCLHFHQWLCCDLFIILYMHIHFPLWAKWPNALVQFLQREAFKHEAIISEVIISVRAQN